LKTDLEYNFVIPDFNFSVLLFGDSITPFGTICCQGSVYFAAIFYWDSQFPVKIHSIKSS
jgi:hypothetical protein